MTDPASEAEVTRRLLDLPETQARFHRFRLGDIECVALCDGAIPKMQVPGQAPSPPGPDGLPPLPGLTPLACLLVSMPGGATVLIDTGFGARAQRLGQRLPTVGRLLQSLSLAGIAPDRIDSVLISHLHPDHIGGLFAEDGAKLFPNATYHAPADEVAFWGTPNLDLAYSPSPPLLKREILEASRRMLDVAGGRLELFGAGAEVLPGIGTMALPGHTPGQVGFILSSGEERLLYTADGMTNATLSVETPGQHIPNDLDPERAVGTRRELIALLSGPRWRNFSPHFTWPALGRIRTVEGRSAWEAEG